MSEGTTLYDPAVIAALRANAGAPATTTTRFPARSRWIHRGTPGDLRYTICSPQVPARHWNVVGLAYAPGHRRIWTLQILLPLLIGLVLGIVVGWLVGTFVTGSSFPFAGVLAISIATALIIALILILTRVLQGRGHARRVVTVRNQHAAAMVEIDEACRASLGRGVPLDCSQLLWEAAHDEQLAVGAAHSLAMLPDEEDDRVLGYLQRTRGTEQNAGEYTMLKSVFDDDPDHRGGGEPGGMTGLFSR